MTGTKTGTPLWRLFVFKEDVKREKRVSLEWLCAMVTKGTQALSVCLASCSLLSNVAGPASAKKKQRGLAGCSELFIAREMLWLKSNNESNRMFNKLAS